MLSVELLSVELAIFWIIWMTKRVQDADEFRLKQHSKVSNFEKLKRKWIQIFISLKKKNLTVKSCFELELSVAISHKWARISFFSKIDQMLVLKTGSPRYMSSFYERFYEYVKLLFFL